MGPGNAGGQDAQRATLDVLHQHLLGGVRGGQGVVPGRPGQGVQGMGLPALQLRVKLLLQLLLGLAPRCMPQ